MGDPKGILQSRTFWLNILATAAWASGLLPPKYAPYLVGAANIGMRFITDSPVSGFFK